MADVLVEVGRAAPTIDAGFVADLRGHLDDVARRAVARVDDERLPLRLSRDRIGKVLACERHLVAASAGERGELSEPVVRGIVLDRLLHLHAHGESSPRSTPGLALAVGALEAERADDVVAWLEDPAHRERRERLAEDATAFATQLDGWGPLDAGWWPRCEDRVRVDLAGGAVVCSGRLDLVLGGSCTDRPLVLVEAKSGRFGADHRDGLFWYALLAALRHDPPPAAVVGWSALDGGAWWQPVHEGLLRAAAARAAVALERIGELMAGRRAAATPCRACTWCPVASTCDARAAAPDDGDGDDGW